MMASFSSNTTFGELQNNSTQYAVSNNVGMFKLNKAEYDVSYTTGDLVKAYGFVNKPHDQGKITISYTLPDGSIKGYQIFINSTSGYFESHFPLDYNSQKGQYNVLVTYDFDVIGSLSFRVQQIPVKMTPVANSSTHNQTNILQNSKKAVNQTETSHIINSTNISNATKIIFLDTKLTLDYTVNEKIGYVNVYAKLSTNVEPNLSSNKIIIFVDKQQKTFVSTNTWSSDIWIGTGNHTITAMYLQTKDPKNSSIVYKESNTTKIILVQEKSAGNIVQTKNLPTSNMHPVQNSGLTNASSTNSSITAPSEIHDYTYLNYVLSAAIVVGGFIVLSLSGRKQKTTKFEEHNQLHENQD